MSESIERRLRALSEELAAAVADVAGRPIAVVPSEMRHNAGWRISLTTAGDLPGRLIVTLDGVAATQLTAPAADRADASAAGSDEALADLLRAMLSRVAVGMAARGSDERLAIAVESVEPSAISGARTAEAVTFEFALDGLAGPIPVAFTWTPAPPDAASGRGTAAGRLDVLLDIDLPVVVRFGHTQMPIRALSRLGPGSVIELGRSPDDPVEVLVSNRVVARGEVVIVGGNYGVRILDVTSQSERARSMEG